MSEVTAPDAPDHPLQQCTPELTLRFLPSDIDEVIHMSFRWDYLEDHPLVVILDGRTFDGVSAARENWDSFCNMTREQVELLHGFLGFVLSSAKIVAPSAS